MAARLYSSQFLFLAMVITSFYTCASEAAPRLIVIPGKIGILLMEGVSSGGQDPDPQRLYDGIAMPAVHEQDGDGKVMATDQKEFSLTCAKKSVPVNNVVCTMTVKPSSKSKLEFRRMEFHADGPDAKMLNEKLAGSNINYHFESGNQGLKIESTPERFDFSYQQ